MSEVKMYFFPTPIPNRKWKRKTRIDGKTEYGYEFGNVRKAEKKLINDVIRGFYVDRTDQRITGNKSITGIFNVVRGYFRNRKSTSEQHFRRTGRN
ncbi:MAG: hypothetical protein GY861_11775 [bacterium]|nr:hypothetical protein [bacterium]